MTRRLATLIGVAAAAVMVLGNVPSAGADSSNHRANAAADGVPTNTFAITSVVSNKKRGNAIVDITVPGPGVLTVTGVALCWTKHEPGTPCPPPPPFCLPNWACGPGQISGGGAGTVALQIEATGKKKQKL